MQTSTEPAFGGVRLPLSPEPEPEPYEGAEPGAAAARAARAAKAMVRSWNCMLAVMNGFERMFS